MVGGSNPLAPTIFMSMKTITIGLIGFGTIGKGVVKTLQANKELVETRIGAPIQLKWVADLDITSDRGVKVDPSVLTTDAMQVVNDPDVDVVIELIGGCGVAKHIILSALRNGKSVITANKALLAEHGNEIFSAVQAANGMIAYEASVCGGIPVIKALREGLVANNIQSMYGIINGTANYILTKMTQDGISYEEALKQAQALGYAEADPTLDVEGIDAAHKLLILGSLATGAIFEMSDIYIEGIRNITDKDIQYAAEFGYGVKLLGIYKQQAGSVELRVHPTLLPESHLLSSVMDAYNAVFITGDIVGHTMYYGRGAGELPTASAVVADLVDIGRSIVNGKGRHNNEFTRDRSSVAVRDMNAIESRYYLRFSVIDIPGVLGQITGVLGKYRISISDVYQKERRKGEFVPLVMITHHAKEQGVRAALNEIDQLDVVKDKTLLIRMED
ncbi:MAG: homoserine dehydrogenase [Candidatus Auribacterota bacterium]